MTTRRSMRSPLLLAVALLAAGACSSGGGEAAPVTTTTEAPTTTTTLASSGAARTTAADVTVDVVAGEGSRTFTATTVDGERTATFVAPVPGGDGLAVAMAVLGQQIDGPLSLVVVQVSPDVVAVSAAEGSQPVADIVAPADGLAALAVIGGYDRIEARGADGRVLTTCFAEPLADAGGQCVSQTPLPDPTTTTAPPD